MQTEEILDNLQQQIMAVENNPDETNWKALKRSFHTLKGDSKAMGFDGLSTFAHKVEDFITGLNGRDPDKTFIDLLFECADSLKTFCDALADGKKPDVSGIL